MERIPDEVRTRIDWLVLLAGPTIWISHFMLVYLAGEAACTPADPDQWSAFGADALTVLTVVATVVAVPMCVAVAGFARRRTRERDGDGDFHYVVDLARMGFLTAIGAGIGVVAVAAPVLYLRPLC